MAKSRKEDGKINWKTKFKDKWTEIVVKLWPQRCKNTPLSMNFTQAQWESLYTIFHSDFQQQFSVTIGKTCTRKGESRQQIENFFEAYFRMQDNIEKLFGMTKQLLQSVPSHQHVVAMQNDNAYLQTRQGAALQAQAITAYNHINSKPFQLLLLNLFSTKYIQTEQCSERRAEHLRDLYQQ